MYICILVSTNYLSHYSRGEKKAVRPGLEPQNMGLKFIIIYNYGDVF